MKYMAVLKTKIGDVFLVEENEKITEILFSEDKEAEKKDTAPLKKAKKELEEYFAGKRQKFTFSLELKGTDFQKKVWSALCDIPYGETRTYKQIAEAIGNPKASRAIGLANHNNPIAIVVPCHRVIGANGKLVGYAGGLEAKETLLELEKNAK